jgi:hypothetical protein
MSCLLATIPIHQQTRQLQVPTHMSDSDEVNMTAWQSGTIYSGIWTYVLYDKLIFLILSFTLPKSLFTAGYPTVVRFFETKLCKSYGNEIK